MKRQPEELVAGKYRLVRRLARGGMGAVWQAVHIDLQADVALKFIRSDTDAPQQSEERFRREARVLAQLKSPHIVQVLDFGVHDGSPYIAMELLRGQDLGLLLAREGVLAPEVTFPWVVEAARALQVAHEVGIIHRDIKPSNLFVIDEGVSRFVKVIDFGIAKQSRVDSNETTQGLVLGSPAFMSPEQARGGFLDASTDVWSLAAVAYRMLTGSAPIEGANANDTVIRICTESPRLASEVCPSLGTAFDALFERAFRRDRAARHGSLDDFIEHWAEAMREHFAARGKALPEWHSPLRSRSTSVAANGKLPPEHEGRVHETAPLLLARAHHTPTSERPQGRDVETASISLARNAFPKGPHAEARAFASFKYWFLGGTLAAAALIGWLYVASGVLGPGSQKLAPAGQLGQTILSEGAKPGSSPQKIPSPHQVSTVEASARTAEPEPERSLVSKRKTQPAAPRPAVVTKPQRPDASRPEAADETSPSSVQPASRVSPPTDPLFGLPVSDP